jgi:molybdopterin molybdotransferase
MTTWRAARQVAEQVGRSAPTRVLTVPVARAAGLTLAADAHCLRALPRFDNSAMDGWALAGDGPWRVGEAVLAGSIPPSIPLQSGEARPVATGAPLPPGTFTVLRNEYALRRRDEDDGVIDAVSTPGPGCDIRREGEEAGPGEVLLAAASVLTPPARRRS